MQLNSLQDLLVNELHDLRSAEMQLTEALPEMASAASHDELRQAFEHHLSETRDHLARLDEILAQLGGVGSPEMCEGMQGLIREGRKLLGTPGDPAVRDAALIAAAQRIEHYEIAAYGTVRTLADDLGLDDAKDLLDQTLEEEGAADKLLTKLATGGMFKAGINQRANG